MTSSRITIIIYNQIQVFNKSGQSHSLSYQLLIKQNPVRYSEAVS